VTTQGNQEVSTSGTASLASEAGTEPKRIYHYTDAAGLLGIVQHRALWATDVWFMNDSVEATYGWARIEQFLRSRAAQSSNERKVADAAADILRDLRDRGGNLQSFIACLSKNGDQLSQWRAYGGGRGFSIGFDESALGRLASLVPPLVRFRVTRVAYDEYRQDTLIDLPFRSVVTALPNTVSDDEAHQVALAFVTRALGVAPALKHPAFKEEAEVRLHIFLEPEADAPSILRFRNSAMGVTPYVEIPLCEPGTDQITVMSEVIIGPQRHPAEAQRAAKQLLVCNGLGDIEVKLSQVPLRS